MMMGKSLLRALTSLTVLMTLAPTNIGAQTIGLNTISTIAKSDPLIITGAIGTQNTYYFSSVGSGYRSPWSNTFYANLNVQIYGISMPFAFYYGNNNTSWSFPHISFHIDPTYKNWRAHFGRSNMAFSSYIMSMSFNGFGLEYNSEKWRFGAFYGEFRNAVNDDPTDPAARSPQYSRRGWGIKAGYGSGRNYIDVFFLRAFDRVGSLDEYWQQQLRPQENTAVAVKAGLGITKWLSLRGNLAFSAITLDAESPKIENPAADRWSTVFEAKYSSLMRIAGDISMNISLPNFNTSVFYRMVQPDYSTLGIYYTSHNYHALGINLSTNLFKKVALSASFSGQSDNITNSMLYTTSGYVYSANASSAITPNLHVTAGYSGYRQLQSDGTAHVDEQTRVNRIMHSLHLTPSYSIDGDMLGHAISLSASYTENRDLNKYSTKQNDVRTLAAGVSYNVDVKPWEMSFNSSFSHQQSDGYQTRYTSDVLSLSTGRSFFKEKQLNTTATVSMCYNDIRNQQRMLSVGGYFTASYTLKKVHVFSCNASFNRYTDSNISDDRSSRGTTEVSISLNYNYTFPLLSIKRKSKKGNNPQP